MSDKSLETEIKSWLSVALTEENLQNIDVKINGSTEQGSGYLGDVVFIKLTATKNGKDVEHDLVLKCSKSNETVMDKMRVAYLRESFMYDKVFPAFQELEKSKQIRKPLDSLPKCFGVFNSDSKCVLVLENLKTLGYDLWDSKQPLTRKHIDLVVQEHARFHALSVVLEEQEPEKFAEFKSEFKENLLKKICLESDFVTLFQKGVQEAYDVMQNDLSPEILQKWLKLKDKVDYICCDMIPENEDLKVIIHGDCWNNNFMFKHENGDIAKPKVKMLDWQISDIKSPITDISYFVLACIAPDDIRDMNDILKLYYKSFSDYLTELGSTFVKTYSFEKFLSEWEKFAKYGVMMCILPIKMAYVKKENLPDIAKSAENGEILSDSFDVEPVESEDFKERIKAIIQYAVKNNLV